MTTFPIAYFIMLSDGRVVVLDEPDAHEYGSLIQALWPEKYPEPRWQQLTVDQAAKFMRRMEKRCESSSKQKN